MGHIIKKILGDVDTDSNYENLIIEDNANGQIHIHIKNIRLDMWRPEYNIFYEAIKESYTKIKGKN
jgi:Cu2+-containing amine oxidase